MLLFVDNLTNVDFSYLHPERGLLGETWLASTQMKGALDHQGMVCDFGIVKKTLRNWLDSELDHRLAIPCRSKNLTIKQSEGQVDLTWQYGNRQLECSAPADAIALVDSETITPESVSRWAIAKLKQHLPDSIDQLSLDFNCEAISGDFYHYSHGLKKHDGNCQRIAHGHRSQIRIWQDNQPAPALENLWAKKFEDIYIGTRDDITKQNDESITFAYTTSQGDFELTMPSDNCYLIDTDTTVELIALHIADSLKSDHPDHEFTVKAYEGAGKGAVVSR